MPMLPAQLLGPPYLKLCAGSSHNALCSWRPQCTGAYHVRGHVPTVQWPLVPTMLWAIFPQSTWPEGGSHNALGHSPTMHTLSHLCLLSLVDCFSARTTLLTYASG